MSEPVMSGALTRAAVILPWEREQVSDQRRSSEARLAEAMGLAASIGLVLVHSAIVPLRHRRPSALLGEGQIDIIHEDLKTHEVDLVVMDTALSPVQQRNLERAWGCKVIDRTGLILDIFGERARTREGALQVELAHLDYQRSRLVRSWTHLERQRGGFGFLGGPRRDADRSGSPFDFHAYCAAEARDRGECGARAGCIGMRASARPIR